MKVLRHENMRIIIFKLIIIIIIPIITLASGLVATTFAPHS